MTTQPTIHRHYVAQPLAAPGQAPEWIHVIPAGTFSGVDGRGPFRVRDAAALITASMADGKLALDENHATDAAAPQGQPSPAKGWMVELQARDDGIWARVEWTPDGRELMANQGYRGVSPVFASDGKGNVQRLLRAALTNNPNLQLRSLHSRQENCVDLSALRAALKLPDAADEAAILAAVQANVAAVSAHATQLASIAAAAGAKATDAAGLVTELQAVRANAGNVATMAAQIVGLETQLNQIKAEGARTAATAFIDGAIASGKPIASLRDHYIARHIADAAAVEKEIGALISINAGGVPPRHDAGGGDELSTEEQAVCKKMGQDPKKFAANKKKLAEKREAR